MSRQRYIKHWQIPYPLGIPSILMDLWDTVDRGNIGDIVSLYHDAIVQCGCDEVTAWLPSAILDRIDTAEYELQRGH